MVLYMEICYGNAEGTYRMHSAYREGGRKPAVGAFINLARLRHPGLYKHVRRYDSAVPILAFANGWNTCKGENGCACKSFPAGFGLQKQWRRLILFRFFLSWDVKP
ncbi:unnamed protein product [Caretta caretta]